MLHYLIYTLSLILGWGLLFLDPSKPGLLGVFLCLNYTFYSSYIISRFVSEETSFLKVFKLFGPSFYFIANLFIVEITWLWFLNPINVAFFLVGIAFFDKSNFPKKETQFFIIAFTYLYSFSLYNKWDNHLNETISINSSYDFESNKKTKKTSSLNLMNYKFLTENLDSTEIELRDKYTIIETWNEKCPPCLKAIPEMHDFYTQIKEKANQLYIYIPRKGSYKLDYGKVFSFEKIIDKSKILVDINLQSDAMLEGYPTFLIFDKKGNLVFEKKGYNSNKRKELEEEIKSIVD